MKTYFERLNDQQQADFSSKTDGEFRRQLDKDYTYNKIENTNWESESNYHNSYRIDGKYNLGRTITLKKKV